MTDERPACVPASELYDVSTGARICHPAKEATDAEIAADLSRGDRR